MQSKLVGSDYKRLVSSPKYTAAQKENLKQNQTNWWNAVRIQCRNRIERQQNIPTIVEIAKAKRVY